MISVFGFPLGTVTQIGTFVMLAVACITAFVRLRGQDQSHAEKMCTTLSKELAARRDRLNRCEQECREETKKLHEEIFGLRKQNIAEQIALINIIIDQVDAPALQALRSTLESIAARLENDRVLHAQVGHVLHDDRKGGCDVSR